MSTTLDPMRLRFLLQHLHSEFPGVDYSTLVRTVMEVECEEDPDETWEGYCGRIRQALEIEHSADAHVSIRRMGKIFRLRPLAQASV